MLFCFIFCGCSTANKSCCKKNHKTVNVIIKQKPNWYYYKNFSPPKRYYTNYKQIKNIYY